MYHIGGLCPRTDIQMGHHGFFISLHPMFKQLVAGASDTVNEESVYKVVGERHDEWLKACGYSSGLRNIRVSWGEWGPEHISVPGNACGLDIDRGSFGCVFRGGMNLCPHNIDSWPQKQLLLIVFTFFADHVLWLGRKNIPEVLP